MIIRLLIALILLYLLYRISKRFFLPSGKKVKPLPAEKNTIRRGEDLVEDPLCHTYVPMSEAYRWDSEGRTFYFCSAKCMKKYQQQTNLKREEE